MPAISFDFGIGQLGRCQDRRCKPPWSRRGSKLRAPLYAEHGELYTLADFKLSDLLQDRSRPGSAFAGAAAAAVAVTGGADAGTASHYRGRAQRLELLPP